MRTNLSYLFTLFTASVIAVQAQTPTFASIDYPNATSTQVWGINPRGDLTGFYVDTNAVTHGFVEQAGQFSSIDYPGAAVTLANGINPRGDIVGEYGLTPTAPHHGFLLRNGVFTTIDYPSATFSSAIGINSSGEIVGIYQLADKVGHGFVKRGNSFVSLDVPGASGTSVNGMNAQGDIAGGQSTAGVSHGFVARIGGFTAVDYPQAAFTTVTGINSSGDMVGRYRDAGGVNHGFLLSKGQFTSIDFPGATYTGATAIDPAGNITGRYMNGSVSHGFLMSRAVSSGSFTITDLGMVGPAPGQPFFISQSSLISGVTVVPGGPAHAAVWSNGKMGDIGTQGLGGANSLAFASNNRGQVVGQAETSSADPNGEDFCGFRSLGIRSTNAACLPFVWQYGVMTPLPTLGGYNGAANSINDAGVIVGVAENTIPDATCPFPQKRQFKPVIWENGVVRELPVAGGDQHGAALMMNQSGQAVGGSGECAPFQATTLINLQPLHALLWDEGTVTDLGNLGGDGHGFGNLALNINNLGDVVGNSDLAGNAVGHAFLWTKTGGMRDLGTLPGDFISAGLGINDSEAVAGVSLDGNFNPRAFYWQNGKMTDLNSMISGSTNLYLLLACSINSTGEIIGLAVDPAGAFHGFLATPAPASSTSHAVNSNSASKEEIRKLLQGAGLGRFAQQVPR